MSNPIAFIDTSWLASLSQLGDLGGAILESVTTNYEIHITQEISVELATRNLSPSVANWLDNANNFVVDPNPVTDALKADGALTKNYGDSALNLLIKCTVTVTPSEPEGQELLYSARVSLDETQMQVEDKMVNLAPELR